MDSDGHPLPELPASQQLVPAQRDHRAIGNVPYVDVPASAPYNVAEYDSVLLSYWRILRRYKGTVIIVAFLGALSGFLVAYGQTRIFKATSVIEIQAVGDNLLNMSLGSGDSAARSDPSDSEIQTQVRVLQSAPLLERTMTLLKPQKPEAVSEKPSKLSTWRAALNLPASKPQSREQLVAEVAKNLKVRAQIASRIVELTIDSPDPILAAEFLNALTAEFINLNLESRLASSERISSWMERQLEDLKIRLERSDEKLKTYATRAGLLITNEKDSIDEDKLRQLQTSLSLAQTDRVSKQSRFELLSSVPAESLSEILEDGSLTSFRDRLITLRAQLSDLRTTLSPAHYKVKQLMAQIAEIESALENERSNILQRIRNDYESARRREELIGMEYSQQAAKVSEQTTERIQYDILKRELDANRQLYDSILQKVKVAGIASALPTNIVRVIEPAIPPTVAYKPDVKLSTMLGFLAGLALGFGFVLIRDRADRSLREPGDASLFLNLPELGVIPALKSSLAHRYYYSRRNGREDHSIGSNGSGAILGLSSQATGVEPSQATSVELITSQQKPSVIAESFRGVITSLLFVGVNGTRPQVIVLTSSSPSDGKTTVTSNIALALSEIRHKVLLIDGDIRRSRLHKIYGIPNDKGLRELMLCEEPLTASVLREYIHSTSFPGLCVLPSGQSALNTMNLLHSPRAAELIRLAREQFDMVLIDTPPAHQIHDARVLSKLSDGVVFVFRASKTSRDAAKAVVQRFSEDGAPVLGAILNYWDPSQSSGYGYEYYRYGQKGYHAYHVVDGDKSL